MAQPAKAQERVNDFVIKLANVNGTGSASANTLLMKSIFRMGIPVMGKNYFPSNIQGLPTWYEIRVTRDGYVARSGRVDLMVAMNAETYQKDVREVSAGGYLIYDSTWPRSAVLKREDITILGVPLARICNENFVGVRNRILMKNIMYAGVLAALLEIDLDVFRQLLTESFGKKQALVDANMKAVQLGYDHAREHLPCPLPLRLERMDKTAGHIMIDGNTAAGLGAVYAGATVGPWYPITPSTSLMDAFKGFCAKLRVDPETGRNNYAVIQAEDELSAIGMVLGANWNGARAFTATSGPGISLMSEFIGLAYYAEIPAVIFDVQRVGPSTGMPTRTQQCDILLCAYASHGDTKHVLLFPSNPEECFYMSVQAFDLAERLQTPVFVMSDLDIGMNDWMCPALEWDDSYRPDRGKVLTKEQIEALPKFHRYLDVDDDAITYRTLPGVPRRARTSRAAPGTTSTAATPRTPPSTSSCSTGWSASSIAPGRWCPGRRSRGPATARSGWSRSAAATARCARRWTSSRSAASPSTTCGSARSRSAARWKPSWRPTRRSSSSSRTATRSCARCSRWRPRSRSTSCTRSCTTAGCR
jgi:2-oxoglutarate/2-oxoacid ferredoxin oxidoreductase subunit alpha